MSDHTEWEDIAVHVHHRDGPVSIELNGTGPLRIQSGVQISPYEQNHPEVSLHVAADGNRHVDHSVTLSLRFSQETATELGEWLIEHADDEPETVQWGDCE